MAQNWDNGLPTIMKQLKKVHQIEPKRVMLYVESTSVVAQFNMPRFLFHLRAVYHFQIKKFANS